VRFRCGMRNVVYEVLQEREWEETDGDMDWDIFWADTGWVHEHFDHTTFLDHQRVNHFRNHYELTRKDLLVKNLKRARKTLDREARLLEAAKYTFFPQTFSLPSEYNMFVDEFKKSGGVWIMKPCGRAQGRGIFLIHKLSQLAEWKAGTKTFGGGAYSAQVEHYICQRYIQNPYLIGGKKFDMRIYVLVTSFMPLQVYLYRSGFCRFSSNRFSMKKEDIQNTMIHLTNVAVQKTGEKYDEKSGMKWALRDLKMFMVSRHGADVVHGLFTQIESLVLRSLMAVQNTIIQDKRCFELYGYDIMIDSDLKPWLLEVNASPSLTSDTQDDHELKSAMLHDVLDILDMDRILPPNHSKAQVSQLATDYGVVECKSVLTTLVDYHDYLAQFGKKSSQLL